jgi:hypothetical protein
MARKTSSKASSKRSIKKNTKKTSSKNSKASKNRASKNSKSKTSKKPRRSKVVSRIRKRDGSIVPFELDKIVNAIFKAMIATGEGDMDDAELIAAHVHAEIAKISRTFKGVHKNCKALYFVS